VNIKLILSTLDENKPLKENFPNEKHFEMAQQMFYAIRAKTLSDFFLETAEALAEQGKPLDVIGFVLSNNFNEYMEMVHADNIEDILKKLYRDIDLLSKFKNTIIDEADEEEEPKKIFLN